MNSTADFPSPEEIIAIYVDTYNYNCTNLAVFVVILFEYFVTLDREVHFAWGHKLSWARGVFLLNRYLSIVEYFVTLGPMLLPTSNYFSCALLIRSTQVVQIVLYATWAAFSGIRVYAVSARNWPVTLIVVVLAMMPVATNTFAATQTLVSFADMFCMSPGMSFSMLTWTELDVATRSCMIISDATVIVVTWIKTWSVMRTAKRLHIQMSFTSLVLREGIMYFIVMLPLNAVQIIFDFVEVGSFSLILPFVNVLTPILISRFFLNLDDLTTPDLLFQYTTSPTGMSRPGSELRFVDPDKVTSDYSRSVVTFEGMRNQKYGRRRD